MLAFLVSGSDPTVQNSCQNALCLMIQIYTVYNEEAVLTHTELITTTLEGVNNEVTYS